MDPLGTTASIIAVIQLSSEVVGFIRVATGATKERKCLREEVQACDDILQQIKDESDESEEGKAWSKTIEALQAPGAPLDRLWTILNIVKAKLQPRNGMQKILVPLKWPLEGKDVEKIIGALEREKSLLSLALTNNCRKLNQDIKKSATENTRHLLALIDAVRKSSEDTMDRFSELRAHLLRVQEPQAGVREGIDRLNHRNDHREATEEHKAILDWLTPVDYASQQNDLIDRWQTGTGQWLLAADEYQTWLQVAKKTLFCPGIPGAGKTILTAITVEDLTKRFHDDADVAVAYIYCNFRRQDDQKAGDLLASLLKQLSQTRSVPDSVKALYNKHRGPRTRPSLDEISQTLQSVALLYSRVFIVIDALDECQTSDGCRARFLAELFKVQAGSTANIFATSRHLPEITERIGPSMSVEVRASEHDVRRYLDSRMLVELPSFVGRNPELQEHIKSEIVRSVQGMFLLAQLHLDSLVGKSTPKAIRQALAKLPTASEAKVYDSAYKSAMERIDGQLADQKELAKQILSWITCSERPLTTLELQHALAVEIGETALDEDNLPQIEDMMSICAGLVTVDKESAVIRLVHYTTQEYFQRTQPYWFPDAEAHITTVCVTYLSFDIFETGFCPTDEQFERRLQLNPLYYYAAHHWGHHARRTASTFSEAVMNFLQGDTKVEASVQALWVDMKFIKYQGYSQEFPRQMTGLHLVAYFGVIQSVKTLTSGIVDIDVNNSRDQTPLWYAATNGHEAVVRILVEKGAAIDVTDEDGQTPLWWAAFKGHKAVMRLLVEKGAAVDLKDKYGHTLLSWAAAEGYEAIVRLLVEKGAAVDVMDMDDHIPLSRAVAVGYEAIVWLLVDKSGVVDTYER